MLFYEDPLIVMMLSCSMKAGYLSEESVLIVWIIESETFAVKPLIRAGLALDFMSPLIHLDFGLTVLMGNNSASFVYLLNRLVHD